MNRLMLTGLNLATVHVSDTSAVLLFKFAL